VDLDQIASFSSAFGSHASSQALPFTPAAAFDSLNALLAVLRSVSEEAVQNFNFSDFRLRFTSIVLEAMPFIVLGALISGVLEEMLPQKFFQRLLPKSRTLAIVASSLLGVLMPMCECGIVPVMRRLLKKGVPASCAITYMLSAPGMNFIVLSSTALAFWGYAGGAYDWFGVGGLGMVVLRGGFAFLTAVAVGLIVERMSRRGAPLVREDTRRVRLVESDESRRLLEEDEREAPHAHDGACEHAHGEEAPCGHVHGPPGRVQEHIHAHKPRTVLERLHAIAEISLGDFIDIAAFLVVGALLAAAVNTALPRQIDQIASQELLSIAVMMGLAFVLSLCSEADAFVAANFTGMSTGARLGFLVLGPMLDVKLLIMYHWVFRKRLIWTMIPVLIVMIFSLCALWNLVSPSLLPAFQSNAPQ
jgi:uncharacterized membrane protein YraQ (UPF0718 family)